MEFQAVKKLILNKLKNELPDNLYYHGYHHTLDVFNTTKWLCEQENINNEDKQLLLTAALFHDSGFTKTYQNHEEKGCEIVRNILPNFNYSSQQIEKICGMIMATKIPQSPQNHLEQILCDADLDYLGRNDFYAIGNTLRDEFKEHGIIQNEQEWNRIQVKFLSSHTYFTQTCIQDRKERKLTHLEEVKAIVARY